MSKNLRSPSFKAWKIWIVKTLKQLLLDNFDIKKTNTKRSSKVLHFRM